MLNCPSLLPANRHELTFRYAVLITRSTPLPRVRLQQQQLQKKRRIIKTNFSVLNLLCSHFAFCNQWLGESWLRSLMEGRIVLVKLLCKDTANTHVGVFSPCIAFRVAGSPGTVYAHLLLTSLAFILLLLLLPHLLRVLGYGSSIVARGKTVLYLFVTHAIF